jgi:molybdopterin molybdotransferase
MLSFDEARARLLAPVTRLDAEPAPLSQAAGRVLASDLVATMDLPRYDFSAMDGYALNTSQLTGAGPWSLPVRGESKAGQAAPELLPGCVCRIFTGAPIPAGADAVVMQEQVQISDAPPARTARFDKLPKVGAHIRRAGEDLKTGARALQAGTRLHAGHVALAAMLGQAALTVTRRPVVTILCTGDELRAPGTTLEDAQIYESNSDAVATLARQAGAVVRVAPRVADDPSQLERAVIDALQGTDLLVTVGGVSVGEHDFVKPALERAGVTLDFWKVAIKPGKPLVVGRSAQAHVLGLPGNPASALVTFALFGMPLLRTLQGDNAALATPQRARLERALARSAGRLEFARAALAMANGEWVATVHDNQSSGAATSLAWCNGLVMLPPEAAELAAGAAVEGWRFSDF